MGEIERKVVEEEGVLPQNFNIIDIKNIKSRGIRRNILAPVYDMKWRQSKNSDSGSVEKVVELDFKLFRGTYATVLLRELMKGDILSY